ncbi:MAG: KpsF/GutQ family sugar-phosphate isomerase [Nanoarchaeota archaeon]
MNNEINKLFNQTISSLCEFRDNCEIEIIIKIIKEIVNLKGKIIFSGVGKSGFIAKKAAASFSSTGFPSIYLNPLDATHGDLGIVKEEDLCILISHSGSSQELVKLIPILKNMNTKVISITKNNNSSMARNSHYHISTFVDKELCPFNLAPTTSTTVTLAILDVLMIIAMKEKGFTKEKYAQFHPSGPLGKRLLLKIDDLIDGGPPIINITDNITQLITSLSEGKKGLVCICDNKKLLGIITDGDLRRALEKFEHSIFETKIENIMIKNPKVVNSGEKAIDVLNLMEEYNITAIPIIENEILKGVINIHDILKEGLK